MIFRDCSCYYVTAADRQQSLSSGLFKANNCLFTRDEVNYDEVNYDEANYDECVCNGTVKPVGFGSSSRQPKNASPYRTTADSVLIMISGARRAARLVMQRPNMLLSLY